MDKSDRSLDYIRCDVCNKLRIPVWEYEEDEKNICDTCEAEAESDMHLHAQLMR